MTAGVDRRRRGVLAVFAFLAASGLAPPLAAQDARSGAAQRAARDWLALTDKLDGAAAWNAAGAKFRAASPVEHWSAALKQVRGPLGDTATRTIESTRFAKSLPGFPAGDYAVVIFRTTFASGPAAHETVTLELEGAAWRVVGYAIG
jgi:hypothetical protein